jgi:hypothetical protein
VIDKALAKNPDQRFQTGEEFAQALRKCVAAKTTKRKTGTA